MMRIFAFAMVALSGIAAMTVTVATASEAARSVGPLCLGKRATIVGTSDRDILSGTGRADVIAALGGADEVDGFGGNDLICGGPGDDVLNGAERVDRLDGGPGFDTCRTGERLTTCEETHPALPRLQWAQIAPGEYVTDVFRPRVTLQLGSGWIMLREARIHDDPSGGRLLARRTVEQGRMGLSMRHGSQDGSPRLVFDSLPVSELSVNAVLFRIARASNLSSTTPTPVTISGAAGQRLWLAVPVEATGPVTGAALGWDPDFELVPGERARVDVVRVGGRTLSILALARNVDLEPFLPLADEVLGSVKWRG